MKKLIILFVLAAFVFSACEKLEYVTEDPNNFTNAPAELMINAPMLANDLVVEGELARISGIWSGYFTGADRQYLSLNKYITTAGDYDNIWGTLYADGISQARLIQKQAIANNNPELEGVAMIVEANLAMQAAAFWGDVPFTEVGDVAKYPHPHYEDQAIVYTKVLELLGTAISKVGDATGDSYGSETIGASNRSSMLWKEVAHSLRARAYLHTGKYTEALAEALLGISSPAGSWTFEHNGGSYSDNIPGTQNLYFDFCAWNRDGYMGAGDAHLVSVLNERVDSRLYYFYLEPGWWNGDWYPNVWNMAQYGYPYDGIFDAGVDFSIISYAENELIKAECFTLANNSADALVALNNVVAYWNSVLGDGAVASYVETDYATGLALLKAVLTEKYISCYGQTEAFHDMRRTKNFIGIPVKAGAVSTKYPERLLYPQSEINSNENVPALIDIFTPTKVNTLTYKGASL